MMDSDNSQLYTFNSQPIPPGYKQTDAGVLPEDWEAHNLENVCSMKSGESITAARINEHTMYPCYGGNGLRGYTTRFTHDGEFALIGRQGALCGNVVGVNGKFFASEHAIVVTPKEWIEIRFLTYVLSEMNLNRFSESSAQPGLSVSKILKFPIAVPKNKTEQRAIATALSDVDALIESLDKLIAKKRNLKQAVMQELLTGKTRLPGFSEDWVVKKLGDICNYQNGKSLEKLFNNCDGFKVISIGNYSPLGKFVVTDTFIDKFYENIIAKFILRKDELTMILNDKTAVGTIIGRVLLIDESDKYVFNQRTMRLSPKINYSPLFLYFKINSEEIHNKIVELSKPGTQIYVNTNDIIDLELKIPLDYEEQTAIATILSDMDAEIATLEARRAKTLDLKKGMMQELLTGKTRLVKPEVSHVTHPPL